jgi:predicted DNA-binding protein (UPF0251 family)
MSPESQNLVEFLQETLKYRRIKMPVHGLNEIVKDFAECLMRADSKRPRAKKYNPGIAPFDEKTAVRLVVEELKQFKPKQYGAYLYPQQSYPEKNSQGKINRKCDLCVGHSAPWEWAIEIKLLRFLGNNGKPNDNMLTHILSPYEQSCSSLTDAEKLVASSIAKSKAIIIYGFENDDWPLSKAIEAFETLAARKVHMGSKVSADFRNLIHPIHKKGKVFGWKINK